MYIKKRYRYSSQLGVISILIINSVINGIQGQTTGQLLSQEIIFPGSDIELAATLTIPDVNYKVPAVVLISGSGPQDRDGATGAIPEYRPFIQIADHLVASGVAVLRYDDRGVGKSSGKYIQAEESDFIGDAEAAFKYLLSESRINRQQIGLMGHSEGALIAAKVAANNSDVAFVISMAGGAVPGKSLLLRQAERQALALGMELDKVAEIVREQNQIFDLVIDQDWDELTQLVTATIIRRLDALPDEKKAAIGDLKTFAESRAVRSIRTFQHPRYQYLLNHDFGADWQDVNIPVLAVFGELDVQCDADQNKAAIMRIFSQKRDY